MSCETLVSREKTRAQACFGKYVNRMQLVKVNQCLTAHVASGDFLLVADASAPTLGFESLLVDVGFVLP